MLGGGNRGTVGDKFNDGDAAAAIGGAVSSTKRKITTSSGLWA
jgi:hypothetical protein